MQEDPNPFVVVAWHRSKISDEIRSSASLATDTRTGEERKPTHRRCALLGDHSRALTFFLLTLIATNS